MTPQEIEAKLAGLTNWRHTIDLGHGLSTPGAWSPSAQAHITAALDEVDFSDAKVLDVGCLDGRWSFESEQRGAAEVFSIDLLSNPQDPGRESYFQAAAEIVGSRAHYDPHMSVYDVARLGVTDFDIVLFMGVYYHLRDPLLAFSRLRQVMKEGAVLVVEGQVVQSDEVFARFFYRAAFGNDRTNWWVPSPPCLREWIESSYFSVEAEYPQPPTSHGGLEATARRVVLAVAVSGRDPNVLYPDAELERFDR